MAFTLTFRLGEPGAPVPAKDLVAWVTEVGEPSAPDGADAVALRALPVRFVTGTPLQAQLEVHERTPLVRLVDVVFQVAARLGADVNLTGKGVVHRSDLWFALAEEQDRVRIAHALRRAREHGHADEVHKRLWAVLAAIRPGHDNRWDATLERVVELCDVGEQLSIDEARWHAEDPKTGDVVQVPVEGPIHVLVWRWLSEAWPGLCEPEHSLH